MNAQPPATKASGVSALLASFSPSASPLPPPPKQGFLSVILNALTTPMTGPDPAPAAQPSDQKPSPSVSGAAESATADATAAGLLLSLLTPPLPLPPPLFLLAKPSAHKSSVPFFPSVPSVPVSQSRPEAKPTRAHAGEKPLAVTVQPPPTETAPEKKPLNPVAEKTLLPLGPLPPASGTSVATINERMNYSTQRNEFAGPTEQKLPPAAVSALGGASPAGAISAGAKSSLAFSWSDPAPEQVAILALPAKTAGEAAPAAPVSAPLDRIEQMISRGAASVRQTGEQTLGILLKLDSNTRLFLQLTTRNGLVQASVRCDRGRFAPEDSQWAQLRQSLARQNVELLPMTASSKVNSQHPPEEPPRPPATREDWAAARAAAPPALLRKQKKQNRPPKNWESWA